MQGQVGRSGPSARALFFIAGLTTTLACIPVGGGLWVLNGARQPVRAVTVAQLMSPSAVPAGSFVTVTLTPDLVSLAQVRSNGSDAFLFGAHDEPRLILYAGAGTDLGREIASAPGGAETPHVVEARVWDLGDYSRLSSDMPGFLVDQQAEAVYGEHLQRGVRVLEVGVTPAHLAFIGALSLCTCGVPLALLTLLALVRGFRALSAGRT